MSTGPFGPPPPLASSVAATESTAPHPPTSTSKSVQFSNDPPQSFSDSEIERTSSRHSLERGTGERRRRSGKRAQSPASDDSSDTVELPRRFDEHGRPIRHDSVADALEAFLLGRSRPGGASSGHAADNFMDVPRRRRRRSSGQQRGEWNY